MKTQRDNVSGGASDDATSAAAHTIYGALLGVELNFNGAMDKSAEVLNHALDMFLADVVSNGSVDMGHIYAASFVRCLLDYTGAGELVKLLVRHVQELEDPARSAFVQELTNELKAYQPKEGAMA